MLMALLLPAVLAARAAARRTDCLHRMTQVGKALNSRAIVKEYYPGYQNPGLAIAGDPPTGLSWVVSILPSLTAVTCRLRSTNSKADSGTSR